MFKKLSPQIFVIALSALLPFNNSFGAVFGPPFHFKDGQSHERKDIKKKIKSFRVQTSRNPLPSLVYVETSDVKLVMFTEIAEMLERTTQPDWSVVPSPYERSCQAHLQKNHFAVPALASFEPRCVNINSQLAAFFSSESLKSCRYTYLPEAFVEERAPGSVREEDLENLEGLLAVPLEALRRIPSPTNLMTPEQKNQLREIIVKVRAQKLRGLVAAERTRLEGVLSSLEMTDGCYAEDDRKLIYTKIHDLYQEVTQAGNYIQNLETQGQAQALADSQRIRNAGKQRATLPFPTLTDKDRQFISMYLGGIYWRMRGGGLVSEPQGTQKTRYWYNYLPMKMIGYINGGSDGEEAGQLMFLQIFQGWGEWMDMGRTAGGNDAYYDLTYMTDRGVDQVKPLMSSLALKGYESADLAIGGMQMGVCYYFAWDRLPRFLLGADLTAPYAGFIDGPTAVGELCTGASISLGLSKTLLNGK
ncbi:MAG: hypothetical protein OM95_00530 [Bdellovibrio sp. ArHS]|uniref:hypothetical protein n=1 Tax=Bdellovibrio sp. ArHS TaxID=1569284 RepID=UPI00058329B3|nr:hypothetical protein [Bdellovibrio sp. ArHS]KHD90040.1 MAG: hypothetical protein OM95_00530 [Bdellovibrio sp. ArHS]